jgi:hypothetical protein
VCVLKEMMEVVSVFLSVFTWGHNSKVTVEVEHWCGKIPVETSWDVKVSDEVVVDGYVCVDSRDQSPYPCSLQAPLTAFSLR